MRTQHTASALSGAVITVILSGAFTYAVLASVTAVMH